MKTKTVEWTPCSCGKRAFEDDRAASKALGRAQAKRERKADASGTRRGMYYEGRTYICPESGLLHLTSESRRSFNDREMADAA